MSAQRSRSSVTNTISNNEHSRQRILSFIKDYRSTTVLQRLVEQGQEWSTPGSNALHGKKHKNHKKLIRLVTEIGEYGPILDLIIRSTIPEMMVRYYSEQIANILKPKSGVLKENLIEKVIGNTKEPNQEMTEFIQYVNLWFTIEQNLKDYNTAFREKRAELINNQVSTLLMAPYCVVSNFAHLFIYLFTIFIMLELKLRYSTHWINFTQEVMPNHRYL